MREEDDLSWGQGAGCNGIIELKYLGIWGSCSRTQRLLDGRAIPAKISSPVGLAIGAEGPEEIAISIVAELIQRQRSQKD